jgi:hypothetical protein
VLLTLAIAGLALAALAGFLVWSAADRLWHGLAIAALAVAMLPWVAGAPAGDVSRILPAGTFTDGIEGKDQIAMASAAATILLAVMLAACAFGAAKAAGRKLRRS